MLVQLKTPTTATNGSCTTPVSAHASLPSTPMTPIIRRSDRIMSRREVESMIADGHTIVIYDRSVLKLDKWIERHPGGKLPVLHMVGVDATSEIAAYHSASTLRTMSRYRIGRIEGKWLNFKPPIRGGVFEKTAPSDSGYSSLDEEEDTDAAGEASKLRRRAKAKARDDLIDEAMDVEVQSCLRQYPDVDHTTQQAISTRFRQLHDRVQAEGYYRCDYRNYLRESVRYSILLGLSIYCFKTGWFLTSALFLGCFWQQIMFTAHDAGHRGITQRFVPDTLIGIFIADFCCGLSMGWWKSSHNVHHLVTNAPEHDPDIQNTPLFATCPSQFRNLFSTYYKFTFVWDRACEILLPYQKYAYYPIMALARFNLYLLGWCHLLSPRSKPLGSAWWTRPVEIAAMACYWLMFAAVMRALPNWTTRVAYVLVSHLCTMVLHVQITLSHWGMPTCDLGEDESFAQRQLRTTMDVFCPAWLDWIHGGLQFQAIHHLFPRVPRHNLRALQPLVQQFCQDTGIKYTIYGFAEGNKKVVGRLSEISHQLEMLGKCQDHMAATGESGLH